MSQQLHGKVILITGAASGIGAATANECARRGASLALADVNIDALNSKVSSLKSQYPNVDIQSTRVDVADSAAVDAWVTSTLQHFGHIDGAANIAGVETKPGHKSFKRIVDITDDHWRFVIDVNLTGMFHCLRAEMRVMKNASIVNMASLAGLQGTATFSPYTASKHGVVGLTKCAVKEAGGNGVRVNAVCPGPVETPLFRRMAEGNDVLTDNPRKVTAFGRLGTMEEVAKTICFLLSDESSWVNGTTITVDGGSLTGYLKPKSKI